MVTSFLLRQRRAGVLKTVLLEAGVFRGLTPTISLSTESGKNEKELPPNPKKQSPPKERTPATNLQHRDYGTYTFLAPSWIPGPHPALGALSPSSLA
uniref:NADH dehydrogenase [ubiquinone] flavoprotein 3, mitochondrial n=1 Tax=Bos indicus x Bos taurus TaxID=30522 RepID=A0A4W2HVE3_BOBOX